MPSRMRRSWGVSLSRTFASSSPLRMRSSTFAVTAGSRSDWPAATLLTASMSAAEPICFSRYPDAPAMIASKTASSSENDVSIRQPRFGISARTSRQTSTPFPSGRRTSSTATSGIVAGIRCIASAAVAASPTTMKSPVSSSVSRTPVRTIS